MMTSTVKPQAGEGALLVDERTLSFEHRLEQLFQYLARYAAEHHGRAPSIRQIKDALNISSESVVHYRLGALEKRGRITTEPNVSRSIVIVEPIASRRGAQRTRTQEAAGA